MKKRISILVLLLLFIPFFLQKNVTAQTDVEARLTQLEKDVKVLKSNVRRLRPEVGDAAPLGMVFSRTFLQCLYCASLALEKSPGFEATSRNVVEPHRLRIRLW